MKVRKREAIYKSLALFKFISEILLKTDKINTGEFKAEKDLLDYICLNIDLFCKQFLGDELISFEADKPILKRLNLGPRGKRVDLYIIGKNRTYIIELKNPTYPAENRYGIGQLLDYGREFQGSELLLITTKFDLSTAKTIKHYNLPIRFIYFEKKQTLEYKEDL